jgi:hypothetical protein
MKRQQLLNATVIALTLGTATALLATVAQADPLPGRDLLKFSQQPMIATPILDNNGTITFYGGHDELSTAYGFPGPAPNNQIVRYDGRFMADDFADNLNSPILHVKWWGSYLSDFINTQMPVTKFLISFESDSAADPSDPNSFSHPGIPLLNQTVKLGPLAPGSGTYTEKLIRGPDAVVGESLYEYNAELNLGKDFPELADQVYWLKITALVDVPGGINFDPYNPPTGFATQWGWHNRDYSIQDPLASPNVAPGEFIEGMVGPAVQPTPVWHFQDDAVTGDVNIDVTAAAGGLIMPTITQSMIQPTHYLDNADGPAGAIPGQQGISQFSKDLAFELYTYNIPEPATCALMMFGVVGMLVRRR